MSLLTAPVASLTSLTHGRSVTDDKSRKKLFLGRLDELLVCFQVRS